MCNFSLLDKTSAGENYCIFWGFRAFLAFSLQMEMYLCCNIVAGSLNALGFGMGTIGADVPEVRR